MAGAFFLHQSSMTKGKQLRQQSKIQWRVVVWPFPKQCAKKMTTLVKSRVRLPSIVALLCHCPAITFQSSTSSNKVSWFPSTLLPLDLSVSLWFWLEIGSIHGGSSFGFRFGYVVCCLYVVIGDNHLCGFIYKWHVIFINYFSYVLLSFLPFMCRIVYALYFWGQLLWL